MDPENAPRRVRSVDGQLKDVEIEQVPGNYPAFYANVRDALRGEAELAVQPENVLHSIRLIELAFTSAQRNMVVPYA
jgi:hypothetical protein